MSVSSPVEKANGQNSSATDGDAATDAKAATTTKAAAKKTAALAVQRKEDKESGIQHYHVAPLPNGRPVFPASFAYYDSDTLPEHRPISISTFEIVAMLPGDRPVSASHFDYVENSNLPSERPIAKSTMEYDADNLLPGGSPIVKQQSTAGETLMGFLD